MSDDAWACLPRDPRRLLKVVGVLDPEHNPKYQPAAGLTFCNFFIADATREFDCPVPRRLANEQYDWLDGLEAAAEGWLWASPP